VPDVHTHERLGVATRRRPDRSQVGAVGQVLFVRYAPFAPPVTDCLTDADAVNVMMYAGSTPAGASSPSTCWREVSRTVSVAWLRCCYPTSYAIAVSEIGRGQ
jgi:hypothetical protein